MDMMDTIELKTIKEQAKKVVEELLEAAKMREGQILVVGCSSSEIDSFRIGSHSSGDVESRGLGDVYKRQGRGGAGAHRNKGDRLRPRGLRKDAVKIHRRGARPL